MNVSAWSRYHWKLCRYFGRECYRTYRIELSTSVIIAGITFADTRDWQGFKVAVLVLAIVFEFFVIWHFLQTPWLIHKSIGSHEPEIGTLAGVIGIAVILASIMFGGTELGRSILAARPLEIISTQINAPVPPIVQTQIVRVQGPCKVTEEQINPARLQPPCPGAPPPTQQDTILAINARLTQGDRNRFSNALSDFDQSLDQAESIFYKITREGNSLQNEVVGGTIVNDVQTHETTLDALTTEGRKYQKAFPELRSKWNMFNMQVGYIFGDNPDNLGPNALLNATTAYSSYLKDWNSIQNKNQKSVLQLLNFEFSDFTSSMFAFQRWEQGCRKRLAEMRNSIR